MTAITREEKAVIAGERSANTHVMPLFSQILMMTKRSLITSIRTPEAIIPNVIIGVFFLFVFDASFGGAASGLAFLPIGVSYIAFILPQSVISGALNSPAGQAMVRDVENGYFDKLLLTPISRSALLLGHIIGSGMLIVFETAIILAVAFVMGLTVETGIPGVFAILGFTLFIGMGFGGFTVGIALLTNSAAATQGASFIFFPLSFLTTAFFPLDRLDGWLKVVAELNPITYVLDGLRKGLIYGSDPDIFSRGLLACIVISAIPFFFSLIALRVRTARK